MATSITNQYIVTTPPYATERHLGSLYTIMGRQYRFCAWEPLADVALECGVFVTMTTNAIGTNRVKQLSSASDKIFGVTYLNTQRILTWDAVNKVYKYAQDDVVSLIEEGDVHQFAEVAVNPGEPVYTRYAVDGALTRIGALSNVSGTGLLAVPGAKFLKKITSPGTVPVSLPDLI